MDADALRSLGLHDKEIKAYLACLRLGSSPVSAIAKSAGLLRTTTHELLGSLLAKGLVSYAVKAGVRYFEAVEPKRLVALLEEKKDRLLHVIPDLETIQKSVREKPAIELYEGKAGLKTLLDGIIRARPKELLQLNCASIFEILRFYFPHWIERRIQCNIHSRILQERTPVIERLKKQDATARREIRFLPKGFSIATANFLYNDTVIALTMEAGEIIGLRIKNAAIAKTQRALFEHLWSTA